MRSVERQRKRNIKITKTFIRLKHSLAADDEIEETLAKALKAYDAEVLRNRRPKALDPAKVFNEQS